MGGHALHDEGEAGAWHQARVEGLEPLPVALRLAQVVARGEVGVGVIDAETVSALAGDGLVDGGRDVAAALLGVPTAGRSAVLAEPDLLEAAVEVLAADQVADLAPELLGEVGVVRPADKLAVGVVAHVGARGQGGRKHALHVTGGHVDDEPLDLAHDEEVQLGGHDAVKCAELPKWVDALVELGQAIPCFQPVL